MKRLKVLIPDRMKGNRFDFAISEMLPDYSRSKISNWIKSGHVLINNNSFKPKDKVTKSELVYLTINEQENSDWIPEKIPLSIVY